MARPYFAFAAIIIALSPLRADPPSGVDWDSVQDNGRNLTITWLPQPYFAGSPSPSRSEELLEKLFHVNIVPTYLDGMGYQRRRPLLFAAGKVPDVFWTGDAVPLRALIHHGFVLELPYEVILRHAPDYVKALNEMGPEAWLYSRFEGKNYGLPTFSANFYYYAPSLWRMDWLRNLGYDQPPRTLPEMEEVFYKMRHADPDGNGRQDTYAIAPNPSAYATLFAEIFGAFGVTPFNWMLKDGSVVFGGIQPEAKDALALLAKWYRDGIIDPDYLTFGPDGDLKRFVSGRIGYLGGRGEYAVLDPLSPGSVPNLLRALDAKAEVVPAEPVAGPAGHRGAFSWGGANHILSFSSRLAAEPEKVIRILHMFNRMVTDRKLFREIMVGEEGKEWAWDADFGWKLRPPFDTISLQELNRRNVNGNIFSIAGPFTPFGGTLDFVHENSGQRQLDHLKRFGRPEWSKRDVFGKFDVLPSSHLYTTDLRNLQLTTYAEIIKGDKPLSSFEDFVREWRRRGGDRLTEEAQRMREEQMIIYQKVRANHQTNFK